MYKEKKVMPVDNLLALCTIIEDYKDFDNSIKKYINDKNFFKTTNDLLNLSRNERLLRGKTAKKIYRENKEIIDKIDKYTNINSFLYYNKDLNKTASIDNDLNYFYNYIKENINDLDKIESVLKKIRNLSIKDIELNENLDFSKNKYCLNTNFYNNHNIYYLDNIVVTPNYDDSIIEYKTNDSNYEILLKPTVIPENGDPYFYISKYGRKIKLNSLTFEKDRLPKKLNVNNTFNKIIHLKKLTKEVCKCIKNSVDLSIAIEILKEEYNNVVNEIIKIDDIDKKEYINEVLMSINENIMLLESISDNYMDKTVDNNPLLTKEQLQKEKVLQLTKKELNSRDLC
ncbi:MAG: hypothetical protein IJF92_00935 [Bacilli bacterium]|nr:hypothetical protein [Bacilli bacterium]